MSQSTPNNTPIDRWGIIKNWFNDNQADIVLVIGVILVALIGFGLGRLTAPEVAKKEPVVIENIGENIGSESNVLGQSSTGSDPAVSAGSDPVVTTNTQQGLIVASKNGKKYHWPWCSWAQKIKPENQIWFNSEAEARSAGYEPCAAFEKQAPAGYGPSSKP